MFLATVRQTPGQDGTHVIKHKPPYAMSKQAAHYFKEYYEAVDHVVDAITLTVLQNDECEPILECQIQLEANKLEMDLQAHAGQIIPHWNTDRHLVKSEHDKTPYYGPPIQAREGDPKAQTVRYKAAERIQLINVYSSLQTDYECDTSRHVRILKPNKREERTKLWQKRKEHIKKDIDEEHEVAYQKTVETEKFDDPLQSQRSNGKYGGPLYEKLMPERFTRRMNRDKSCADIRVRDRANTEMAEVKKVFTDLENTVFQAHLPTISGTRYHTGLGWFTNI